MPSRAIVPAAAGNSKLPMRPRAFRFSDDWLSKRRMPPGKREVTQFEEGTGLGIRMSRTGQIYFIVQLKLANGKRHKETLGAWGKITIDAARAAAQARAGKIAMGVDLRAERAQAEAAAKAEAEAEEVKKFTLRVMVDQWRRGHLNAQRPGYALRAFRNIHRTFAPLLDMPAASVTRAMVRKEMAKHNEPKTRRSGRGGRTVGGPSAVHNATVSLKAAYRWALGQELLAENPLSGLQLPKHESERERALTTGEARRVYAAAGRLEYPAQHFIKLLMLTGCRRGEIAGLRWDEIVTADDGRSKAIVLPPGRTKTKTGHHVALSKEALKVIAECAKVVGCPYVLTSDGYRPFANFTRAKGWLDEALDGKIADWRLHDFRRTIVSLLAEKGLNPVMIDRLLGHQPTSLKGSAKIYQRHEFRAERREALEDWAEHLAKKPATVTTHPRAQAQPKTKLTRNRQTHLHQ
jgi:integrase